MKRARIATALLALAAIDAPAQNIGGSFVVEVEVSRATGDDCVAQFRLRDPSSNEILAEPAIRFSSAAPGAVQVAAMSADDCASGPTPGYCMDLRVGSGGADAESYEAFVTRAGEVTLRKRNIALARH